MLNRFGNSFGIALIPTILVLGALRFFGHSITIGLGIVVGAAMAIVFERWAAIAGGFQASPLGGFMIYGSQMIGGLAAGAGVAWVFRLF